MTYLMAFVTCPSVPGPERFIMIFFFFNTKMEKKNGLQDKGIC